MSPFGSSCHVSARAAWLAGPMAALAILLPSSPTAMAQPAGKAGPKHAATARAGLTWAELKPNEQDALRPLANSWNGLHPDQKDKWLAMSRDFASLTPEQRTTLQSRMTEWNALSARDRAQARLNFADTTRLSPSDRKAQWEAYQALSAEEKHRLADTANTRPASAAMPVRPVAPRKLADVPAPAHKGSHGARIKLAPAAKADAAAPAGPAASDAPPAR